MSVFQSARKKSSGIRLRSWVVALCALLVAAFALIATLLLREAAGSLELAAERLGADIIVLPEGTQTEIESALLMGAPVLSWMPADTVQKVAAIPGVESVSPQIYLSTLVGASCCSVPEMFMIAYDPETDFTVRPWLEQRLPEGLGLGEVIGGDYITATEGADGILVYGDRLTLKGNLEPTGTWLDQSLFFTLETAHDIARVSQAQAEEPLVIPAGQVSAVLVKTKPGADTEPIAVEIYRTVPGVYPIQSAHLFQSSRTDLKRQLNTVAVIMALIWPLAIVLVGLVYQMAANQRRVEKRTRELATLLEISNTVSLTMDLEPLLALIFERLKAVVDYDGGAALRLEDESLTPVFQQGPIAAADLMHIGSALECAALGRAVIESAEPMILADVQADPALREAFRQATGGTPPDLARSVRAWMAIPVTIRQQVSGVLYLYHGQPGRYGEEQARLALAFGNQAAVAIENARLYTQAQELATLEERQHLARELHDAVSQTLFSAGLAAEVLPRLWEADRQSGLECLAEVRQLTRGALAEMRALLLELRPAALGQTDLATLLQQLAQAASSRTRIPVTVQADAHSPLPPGVRVTLYRIAQEALNNVAKHAQARQADVNLRFTRADPQDGASPIDRVELTIADDGRGFEPGLTAPGDRGMGLVIMRERAEAIGAALDVASAPGRGTRLTVTWPAGDPSRVHWAGGASHD